MEITNISLDKGIHRTPSLGDASELSECVNLMPQYGEMRNIEPPKEVEGITISNLTKLIYVHQRSGVVSYKNYILHSTPRPNEHHVVLHGVEEPLLDLEPLSITSVGNTLCIATVEGTYYFLWKDNQYVSLGNHIPEVKLSFGLDSAAIQGVHKGTLELLGTGSVTSETTSLQLSDENHEKLLEAAQAILNETEANEREENKFSYPFFVRYALEMFDGSLTMHSSPVLLIPTTDALPVITFAMQTDSSGQNSYANVMADIISSRLTYQRIGSESLDDWKDIIKGVRIFCSSQYQGYRETPSTKFKNGTKFVNFYATTAQFVGTHDGTAPKYIEGITSAGSDYSGGRTSTYDPTRVPSKKQFKRNFQGRSLTSSGNPVRWGEFMLDTYTTEDLFDRLSKCDTFYKLADIRLESIASEARQFVHIPGDALSTLETQEALVEDTNYSHDLIVGNKLMSYNSRLIVADAVRIPTDKIDLATMVGYVVNGNPYETAMSVSLNYSGQHTGVEGASALQMNLTNSLFYIFYPDPNAVELWIEDEEFAFILPLKPHPTLNGAYWFNNMQPAQRGINTSSRMAQSRDSFRGVDQSNRLFISEVDNPFVFKGSKAVTLSSHILNISTAAKALSQGQFGEFPLYAFCEDGIWAVQLNNEGYFSAKQPITRDVLLHPNALCQLDSAVAFVTKEGVKVISGSNTECISIPLHGYNIDEAVYKTYLPEGFNELSPDDASHFFTQLTENVSMVYDAPHQLLHLFTQPLNAKGFHYVNALGSHEWVMQKLSGAAKSVVPGYPLSTLQIGNALYEYDHLNDAETTRKGYFLTRPTFLGDAYSRKALYDLRIMGQKLLPDSSWKVVVLVSNDMRNWARLRSLKSCSVKYYRFLVYSELCDADTMSGITLQHETRYNGKLR